MVLDVNPYQSLFVVGPAATLPNFYYVDLHLTVYVTVRLGTLGCAPVAADLDRVRRAELLSAGRLGRPVNVSTRS